MSKYQYGSLNEIWEIIRNDHDALGGRLGVILVSRDGDIKTDLVKQIHDELGVSILELKDAAKHLGSTGAAGRLVLPKDGGQIDVGIVLGAPDFAATAIRAVLTKRLRKTGHNCIVLFVNLAITSEEVAKLPADTGEKDAYERLLKDPPSADGVNHLIILREHNIEHIHGVVEDDKFVYLKNIMAEIP